MRLNNKGADYDRDVAVSIQKIQTLFSYSFSAVFFSAFNGVLITALFWNDQDHCILLTWLAFLLISAGIRLVLFYQYRCEASNSAAILKWETPYFITLTLTTLVWGIGGLFILPANQPVYDLVLLCFVVAMTGGAISIYSSYLKMVITTILIMVVPIILWFVFKADAFSLLMAIAVFMLLISSLRSAAMNNRTLTDNLKLTHELNEAMKSAELLARIDELTGISNRRAFYEYAENLIKQSHRSHDTFCLVMIDIDHFKRINDQYGHHGGDVVLQHFTGILQYRLRASDICARIGGEEFAILLTSTDIKSAVHLIEDLRQLIASTNTKFESYEISFTASFGITEGGDNVDEIISKADKALYQAKIKGRNRVETYHDV